MPTFRKPGPAVVIPPAVLEALAEPDYDPGPYVIPAPTPDSGLVREDPYAGMTACEAQRHHLAKIATPETEEKAARVVLSRDKRPKRLPPAEQHPRPYNRVTGVEYQGKNVNRLHFAEMENDWHDYDGWAGFHQWKAVGRIVSKGEHGTRCLTVIKTDEKTNVRGFVVFHFAQTEPLEVTP